MSRRRGEGRLILPWEEERERMPKVVKFVLFVFVVGAVLAMMMNQCSVPEAGAETYWESDARRREVTALESIADSLKKIERKMK